MLDWIDPESWQAFRDMRKAIKAPLTPYAEKLVIRELVKLKAAGHDPQACLDQSIRLGWRDVWPLKDRNFGGAGVADELARYAQERPQTPEERASADKARQMAMQAIKRVA